MATTQNPFLAPFGVDVARFTDGTISTAIASLDAYDKAVTTLTDLQLKLADTSAIEWVAAQTRAQVTLVRELNSSATTALRAMLDRAAQN